MKPLIALVVIAAASAEPPGARLAPALDEILADPAARSAFWGVMVVDLSNQATLYARNESSPFIPASNTKLFTTAMALTRLGPDYHFETRVYLDRASRTLVLVGGGDPTLNIEEDLEDLADQIREAGITSVGDVVGDEQLYPGYPYANGWSVDDIVWEYGAPPSALTINENTLRLTIEPGEPLLFSWKPAREFYTLLHSIEIWDGKPDLTAVRPGRSFTLDIAGHMPNKRQILDLAIHDPALFAAQALADALRTRGIDVQGRASVRRRASAGQATLAPSGDIVAWRLSPQLIEILGECNRRSQNLFAELILRETGRIVNGESGIRELKTFLSESGVAEEDISFEDGSGLDRRNLVTPRAVIAVLQRMHASLFADDWWNSLPFPGQEGTLLNRFRGVKEAAAIHAKTGTLTHVSALSGYAGLEYENRIAFAILANNHNNPTSEVRGVIDRLGAAILQYGAK